MDISYFELFYPYDEFKSTIKEHVGASPTRFIYVRVRSGKYLGSLGKLVIDSSVTEDNFTKSFGENNYPHFSIDFGTKIVDVESLDDKINPSMLTFFSDTDVKELSLKTGQVRRFKDIRGNDPAVGKKVCIAVNNKSVYGEITKLTQRGFTLSVEHSSDSFYTVGKSISCTTPDFIIL